MVLAGLAAFANACLLIGGMVFAIARWKRHPRISRLVVTGLGINLLSRTLGLLAPMLLSTTVAPTPSDFASYMQVLSIGGSMMRFVSWVLILRAIFLDRESVNQTSEDFLAADGREGNETGNPYQPPS